MTYVTMKIVTNSQPQFRPRKGEYNIAEPKVVAVQAHLYKIVVIMTPTCQKYLQVAKEAFVSAVARKVAG